MQRCPIQRGICLPRLRLNFQKKDINYIPAYDHSKLDAALNSFAKEVGGTLVQHEVEIKETEIVVTPGKEGLGVDVPAVRSRYLAHLSPRHRKP